MKQQTLNIWILFYLVITAGCIYFAVNAAHQSVWNPVTIFFSAFAAFIIRTAFTLMRYKSSMKHK
ncbi:DUF4305 domain-containing protein [Tuberibacillus sp. Marseille-P3662]|uniref:DUF4305 domain-containing protein n=1 Tax=Tuberibacillus sp. Marseille-P3662 TaxID=1965358 RepID=UPI0020CB3EA9|nr:DUF4305 domain-containing protein [Tuberibacillus sp. Marseille-P3662]